MTTEELVMMCRKEVKVKKGRKVKKAYKFRQDLFKKILEQYEPMMHLIINKLTSGQLHKNIGVVYLTEEDKEDLILEMQMTTARAISSFIPDTKSKVEGYEHKTVGFFTFLYRACHNTSISYCKLKSKKENSERTTSLEELTPHEKVCLRDKKNFVEDVERDDLKKNIEEVVKDKDVSKVLFNYLTGQSIQIMANNRNISKWGLHLRLRKLAKNKNVRNLLKDVVNKY